MDDAVKKYLLIPEELSSAILPDGVQGSRIIGANRTQERIKQIDAQLVEVMKQKSIPPDLLTRVIQDGLLKIEMLRDASASNNKLQLKASEVSLDESQPVVEVSNDRAVNINEPVRDDTVSTHDRERFDIEERRHDHMTHWMDKLNSSITTLNRSVMSQKQQPIQVHDYQMKHHGRRGKLRQEPATSSAPILEEDESSDEGAPILPPKKARSSSIGNIPTLATPAIAKYRQEDDEDIDNRNRDSYVPRSPLDAAHQVSDPPNTSMKQTKHTTLTRAEPKATSMFGDPKAMTMFGDPKKRGTMTQTIKRSDNSAEVDNLRIALKRKGNISYQEKTGGQMLPGKTEYNDDTTFYTIADLLLLPAEQTQDIKLDNDMRETLTIVKNNAELSDLVHDKHIFDRLKKLSKARKVNPPVKIKTPPLQTRSATAASTRYGNTYEEHGDGRLGG